MSMKQVEDHRGSVYRRAVEEGEALRKLLAPYAGLWVALSADWLRVLASDADHFTCLQKAKEPAQRGELPCLYRVPVDA